MWVKAASTLDICQIAGLISPIIFNSCAATTSTSTAISTLEASKRKTTGYYSI